MKKRLMRLLRPGMGMYFLVMAVFCAVALLRGHYYLAVAETVVTLAVLTFYLMDRRSRDRKIQSYLSTIENTLEFTSQGEGPLPAVLVRLGDEGIVWGNHRFSDITGYADSMIEQNLEEIVPELSLDWLSSGRTECPRDVTMGTRRYRVYGTPVRAEDTAGTMLAVLYFSDLTELYLVRDEYIRSRPVVCIILIDNYEELTKNLTESAISTMNARLGDVITEWTEGYHGLLRKLERNRYLFVFEKRDLQRTMEEKFPLLEKVHEIMNPSGLSASISIGMGVDAENFDEGYNFAALSIEMALSRGGDQAVIKDRFNFNFYGGRNREADYSSKVRSRVTANSLMELIGQSDHVFIMGHRNADLDAVGAAVGINCLCRKQGKKSHIVVDLEHNAAQKLIEEIRQEEEYRETLISGQDALLMADNKSILAESAVFSE